MVSRRFPKREASSNERRRRAANSTRPPERPRGLEIAGLFAGVGGLELGLERAGHSASMLCEIDTEAATVLERRFRGAVLVRDVRDERRVLGAISSSAQLLTAGFPCTDLSQAGATKGFEGGRSSLIRDVLRLLEARPFPHVLIENVPNWRVLHGGAYFSEVIGALERLGYAWAYRTIDARAFGLPQRRRRLFLHATLDGDPRPALFHRDEAPDERVWALSERAHGFYWTEGSRGLGWGEDCVPTLKGGSSIGVPAPPAIVLPDLSIVTPDIRDAERLQGLPAGWTDFKTSIDGGVYVARRRWLLIGNAVNVRVSEWIGRNLSLSREIEESAGGPLLETDPWPPAAWGRAGERWVANVGDWPVKRPSIPLGSFLRYSSAPLSERATAGFLARYETGTLSVKQDFLQALKAHLRRMCRQVRRAA